MSEQFGLTQGQQAIWYLSPIDDGYASYNINAALRISPRIESDLVSRAVNQLLLRHPALRASFFLIDGKLQQSIRDSINLDIPLTDTEDMQDNDIGEYLRNISNWPFDLQNDSLLRCEQLQTSQATILHFQIYHIISDFWLISILFDEFMEICNADVEGRKAEHQYGGMGYQEHCENAAALLSTPPVQASKAYWQEKLTAPFPVLTVGTSQKNSQSGPSSRNISFRFTTEETKQLQTFASSNDVSVFAALLAAYARLLGTIANLNEVVVGIPTLGRSKAKEKISVVT